MVVPGQARHLFVDLQVETPQVQPAHEMTNVRLFGANKNMFFFLKNTTGWLVVSTHLKNISQNGNLPQIGVKIKTVRNHQPDIAS